MDLAFLCSRLMMLLVFFILCWSPHARSELDDDGLDEMPLDAMDDRVPTTERPSLETELGRTAFVLQIQVN